MIATKENKVNTSTASTSNGKSCGYNFSNIVVDNVMLVSRSRSRQVLRYINTLLILLGTNSHAKEILIITGPV